MLVTDQGYLKETNVVWETLSSVDGAGHYVDHKFVTFTPSHLGANENSSVLSNVLCDPNTSANDQSASTRSNNPSKINPDATTGFEKDGLQPGPSNNQIDQE